MRGIDDVLDILAIDLLGVVPEDHKIVLSTDRGVPTVFDNSVKVNQAYHNIAQRVMGNNVPLMSFQTGGFWARFKRLFSRHKSQ